MNEIINEIIIVKLDELNLMEKNVRMHPKKQIEEYRRSLRMFGQTKNAVIDEDNDVLIGNGLVIAAREEGWEEIYAIKRTDLSENDKLKLMISDNKIFGLGVDNLETIDGIFQTLKDDLNIPGYDQETLNSMVAEAEEVTNSILDFGKLDNETIANMQNRQMPTISQVGSANSAHTNNLPYEHTKTDTKLPAPEENPKVNEDLIQAKCPKCGDVIWLSKEQLRPLM